MAKNSYAKNWAFTINNDTFEDLCKILDVECRYMVFGFEKGDSGTNHIQGYVMFEKKKTLITLKGILGPRAHVEVARKVPLANYRYCIGEGDYYTFPEEDSEPPKGQGRRSDINNLLADIDQKKTMLQIAQRNPNEFLKFQQGIKAYRFATLEEEAKKTRKIHTEVIWGKAGTGKTSYVYKLHGVHDVFKITQDAYPWWDGYEGQKILLIDDFYGWVKWGTFLNLLDIFPLQLQIKGGFTWALWDKVYITSNAHPSQWYSKGYPMELQRRIHKISYIPEGKITVNTPIDDTPQHILDQLKGKITTTEEEVEFLEDVN